MKIEQELQTAEVVEVKKVNKNYFVITLDDEEMEALAYVCGSISGNPDSIVRKVTNSIYRKADLAGLDVRKFKKLVSGNLHVDYRE